LSTLTIRINKKREGKGIILKELPTSGVLKNKVKKKQSF